MLLIPIRASRSDGGHCWLARLSDAILPGEDLDHARPSPLRLFEDTRELGPASALIDDIRGGGSGAFCHWGECLYFSASDNSDPNTNGRRYQVVAPASEAEARLEARKTVSAVATDSDLLQAGLRASFSAQGAEFHSAYTLRTLLSALGNAGFDPTGKTVLEIGASPSHGLGIALALLGAGRVVLNNLQTLPEDVPMAFATNISVLAALMSPLRRRLSEVVVPSFDGARARLSPRLFEIVPSTDAARLPAFDQEIDLIVSFSVLEHIRHLPEVLEGLRRAIRSDGLSIHGIDLRDHTDFNDPLKFLRFAEPGFLARYGPEHNRWRRADYLRMFREAGWRIARQRFAGPLPTLGGGNTDMLTVAAEGPERMYVNDPSELPPVNPEDLRDLAPEYRDLSPEELAILVLEVTAEPA